MELRTAPSVDISLRIMSAARLRQVHSWFDRLKNWETDEYVRRTSHRLPNEDVYVLTASDGNRIFFEKDSDVIRVVDIASKETIDQFAGDGVSLVGTAFQEITYDPPQCRKELKALKKLLTSKDDLSERHDILPFFKANAQLSAFIGTFGSDIGPAPQIAHEYSFLGDFSADLVVGECR